MVTRQIHLCLQNGRSSGVVSAVKIGEDEDDDDAEEAALMLNFRLVESNESYLAS